MVEAKGVEPLSTACKAVVLPLNEAPRCPMLAAVYSTTTTVRPLTHPLPRYFLWKGSGFHGGEHYAHRLPYLAQVDCYLDRGVASYEPGEVSFAYFRLRLSYDPSETIGSSRWVDRNPRSNTYFYIYNKLSILCRPWHGTVSDTTSIRGILPHLVAVLANFLLIAQARFKQSGGPLSGGSDLHFDAKKKGPFGALVISASGFSPD